MVEATGAVSFFSLKSMYHCKAILLGQVGGHHLGACPKMAFAQTLRILRKIILADSVDFDIKYMAVLIFRKLLDFEQIA